MLTKSAAGRLAPISALLRALAPLILLTGMIGLPSAGNAQVTGDWAAGRRIAVETCALCHVVETGQRPAAVGAPSFLDLARDPAVTDFYLRSFFRSPHLRMPNFTFTNQETDDLIAYIMSLKTAR
jgi:mono/diheme cytochrome c family protein